MSANADRDGPWMTDVMKPLVSILTLTYNHERYIERCIESVLSQTFSNWEMLIVDDGSQDETCERIKRYRDSRIVLIRQENVGLWRMRESYARALAVARGALIAILDGDDWWPPAKLEIQCPAFEDDTIVMSFGAVELYDGKTRFLSRHRPPQSLLGCTPGAVLIPTILRRQYYPYSVTTMVRKKAIDGLGGFIQPGYLPLVDIPTWLNVLPKGQCFGFKELLGFYRIHPSSAVRTNALAVEEGQMRYAIEYLDANWQSIELTDRDGPSLRKELESQHHHIRAVRYIQQRDYYRAISHLKNSIAYGGLIRKVKSFMRLAQIGVLVCRQHLPR